MKKNEEIVLDKLENKFGMTKEEVRKSIKEFYNKMMEELEQERFCREYIFQYRKKNLDEDILIMRKTLLLGNVGIEIVNKMLNAGYFEYDQLYHKSRYIEISDGVRTYWQNVINYITDAIYDNKCGCGDPVPKSWIALGKMISPEAIKIYMEEI